MRKVFKAALILPLAIIAGCRVPNGDAGDDGRLRVLVSIQPQEYFVGRIAGDSVEITVLIPPGASPAAYELSPSDMRTVSHADIWFTVGVTSELAWLDEFPGINPGLRIVDTAGNIERLPIDRYGIPGAGMDTEGHDHHGGEDPHVWLSPELVRSQAETIADALSEADPVNADRYRANLRSFLADITELQQDLHRILDGHRGESFLVFHPAWGYFADEFGLVQVPIEIAGSEPSPGELSALIDHAEGLSVKVVFVSPQFSASSAETIAGELGASVAVIDPLARDWLENMRRVAEALREALE